MELENLSSEHKEIIAQLQLSHTEKINALKEQLLEAESCKSKAEKEVQLISEHFLLICVDFLF